ncbi:MAG: aminopeptidase P family protein [Anaerolineae bacterium]|nr:aminopeptidase P family protein [Anaerolineae bacterium]
MMTPVRFLPLGFDKDKLIRLMAEHKLDAVLLTSPEHVFYTTGFPALFSSGNPILYGLRNVLPFFAFITRQGHVTLMCWGGAVTGVEYGADSVLTYADIAGAEQALTGVLRDQLGAEARLGIESSAPYTVLKLLDGIVPSERMMLADDLMMQVRLIKSAAEVALLEKSINVVERTVAELMAAMHLGIRRPALMQAAKAGMLQHGASGISHVTISFGASNPEVEIDEALEADKLVTLDLGAIVDGYYSDNRRLMYTGSIPEGIATLHRTMCAILSETASALKPGATFGHVYDKAMALYDRHHLKPFIPNIGHTIGMQVEEVWIYEGTRDVVFQAGMVLNLEMYAQYETGELIGDEETYVITETGYRQLTHLPTAIRTVTR